MNVNAPVHNERVKAAHSRLEAAMSGRVSANADIRVQHASMESFHRALPPDLVCYPQNELDVQLVAEIARDTGLALIPFGAGTSLEGHVDAPEGGICIDFSRMAAILAVNADDMDAIVEPGVTRQQLNQHLRDTGLFFAVDPGGEATLAGMAATRASGTNAVRYGTMRDNVLGLRVMLSSGQMIDTGSRARKSSTGYDLTKLFVGSEGTLGLITRLTVRLHPIPEQITAGVVVFESLDCAVETVVATIQSGIGIARAELMDAPVMEAVCRFSGIAYPAKPALFVEFAGGKAAVGEEVACFSDIAISMGAQPPIWAHGAASRTRLWSARHQTHYAIGAMRPGAKIMPTDVCVPISKLSACIAETKREIAKAPFFISLNGHVGDGNFHLGMLIDPSDPEEVRLASEINDRLVHRALNMGGTCSGEHGIGRGKLKFMRDEHGDALEVMRAIKSALDPHGLFNPGKLLPDAKPASDQSLRSGA